MNDYAGLLPADARQRLESALAQRETATGAQMVVAIFPSLEGESLEDFSIHLAEKWRVGQKGLDNGVILLVFVRERRVRMEVGYGLEPVITDAVAGQIVRETIAPRFRERRYAEGLEAAARAVFARVEAKGAAPPPRRAGARGMSPWTLAVLGVFGVVVLMLAIDAMRGGAARRNAYTAGSGQGWGMPTVIVPPVWGGGRGGGGDGGFSAGGGGFGGGGASGDW